MKTLIVGGSFFHPKESSIARKICESISPICEKSWIINGGDDLDFATALSFLSGIDLTIWMPDISNEVPKDYPKKDIGSVLICSKVLREGVKEYDAVTRIFKMNANAVIAIDKSINPFNFQLIDALGNLWISTNNIDELCDEIVEFYRWSKTSVRENVQEKSLGVDLDRNKLQKLIDINRIAADKVEVGTKNRYFGNTSTRCVKLFPTMREGFWFSARNTNKEKLTIDDMVLVKKEDKIYYEGSVKPSIDTPVQLNIYENLNHINFMIHGHAYIEGAVYTNRYFACGDVREANELIPILKNHKVVNLKNHGFLMATDNLEELNELVINSKFIIRNVPEKFENVLGYGGVYAICRVCGVPLEKKETLDGNGFEGYIPCDYHPKDGFEYVRILK